MGKIIVRLLIAKSRLSPIKPTTIPRLELSGGVVEASIYERFFNLLRAI